MTSFNDWGKDYLKMWNNFFEKMMGSKKVEPTSRIPPLEPYQVEAINHIFTNWDQDINTLCALDVGMGKTRVACEILATLFEINAKKRLQGYALVCCSTTGTRDTIWINTLKELGLRVLILDGREFEEVKMKRTGELFIPDLTVCLITYANLNISIPYFIKTSPNLIVFDEYHTLTNNSLKNDKKCREEIMKLPMRLRLGLTATPFVNNEMESVLPATWIIFIKSVSY